MIAIMLIAILLLIVLVKSGDDDVDDVNDNSTEDEKIVTYHVDMAVSPGNRGKKQGDDTDYGHLVGIFSEAEIDRMKANIDAMIKACGGDAFFVINSAGYLGGEEFVSSHGPLMIGDRVELDIASASRYETFMLVPCRLHDDGSEISSIFISHDDEAYKMIDSVKITGAYVADYRKWVDGTFPPESNKLIVFYKKDDGGSDDDDGLMPPTPEHIEDMMFCLRQMLDCLSTSKKEAR